jgi:hypothetical protein
MVLIADITRGQTTVVEFTAVHGFVINEYISLRVSRPYGMYQINEQRGKVLAADSTTVTLDIDSTLYSAFTTPVSLLKTTPPCAVPSSSGINFDAFSPAMILNDCFDNVPS